MFPAAGCPNGKAAAGCRSPRGESGKRGVESGRGGAPGSGLLERESGSGLPQSKGGIW